MPRATQRTSSSSPSSSTSRRGAPIAPSPDASEAACDAVDAPADGLHPLHAVAVDADIKSRNLTRLRRIEGQVRGLQNMVTDDRYCADILTQVASVQQALRGVARELLRNHLKHCAAQALRGGAAESDAMVDELLELMQRHGQ